MRNQSAINKIPFAEGDETALYREQPGAISLPMGSALHGRLVLASEKESALVKNFLVQAEDILSIGLSLLGVMQKRCTVR